MFTLGLWLLLTQPLASYFPLFLLATRCFSYPLFYLLGERTHSLVSLVCYQLPTLCCSSHSNTPRSEMPEAVVRDDKRAVAVYEIHLRFWFIFTASDSFYSFEGFRGNFLLGARNLHLESSCQRTCCHQC